MTMEEWGCLKGCRYLLHDRDTKFCESFRELIGKRKADSLASKKPEFELVRRTLGEISQRGMPGKAHPIWRVFAAASLAAIFAALP